MSSIHTVTVETALSTYPIRIGSGLRSELEKQLEELVASGAKLAALVDAGVQPSIKEVLGNLLDDIPTMTIPSGEKSKSLSQYEEVLDFLAAQRLDRGGILLAIGGGVVGDLGGFAAASYMRGIRFIQIPTTVLAMVDSSIGGKTGVNIDAGKNLVGAFHQPIAVYADIEFLHTLSEREFVSGLAEIIKHGMLADRALFDKLLDQPITSSRDDCLAEIIKWNCEIKAAVVKADEKELAGSGGRALLNLGHTFGHAIENVAGYGDYLHGEAIGIGLAAASRLSEKLGFIAKDDVDLSIQAVSGLGLPTHLKEPLSIDALYTAMTRDKKVKSGVIRFVVMKEIGRAGTIESADADLVREIWRSVGAVD